MSSSSSSESLTHLDTIFNRYKTDKNSKHHNYSRQYNDLFERYRDKKLSFLEIGIMYGESLKAWRDSFSNATKIVGIDITAGCKVYENLERNIFVEIGNACDQKFMNEIINKYGKFDVIVDDGSHTNRDVIKAFELLFPLLNDNGLYVVEDTICYKSDRHQVQGFPNQLEYFVQYVPLLNQWRYTDSQSGKKDTCVDPFKIIKKTNNVFEYSIDKLEFGCSYIAIYKKVRQHWVN